MAARRGKSQARRRGGNNAGLPGWAWLVLGVVLTIAVMLIAPRYLKSDNGDGLLRPRPNPDAQPAAAPLDAVDAPVAQQPSAAPAPAPAASTPEFDFYTVLPNQEVQMTDAQIAAAQREEERRLQREQQQRQAAEAAQAQQPKPQAIDTVAAPSLPSAPTAPATPRPEPAPAAPRATPTPAPASAPTAAPAATAATSPAPAAQAAPSAAPTVSQPATRPSADTPYILQAGAFQASGDAEAMKARIAMLGLNARVESAQVNGNTVYRVRMGPYGTASELADARNKLSSSGISPMAIQAR